MKIIERCLKVLIAVLCCGIQASHSIGGNVVWPEEVKEVTYRSKADDGDQSALFYVPETSKPTALLVALHPWSADYRSGTDGPAYAKECIRRGWAMVHPNFRGPNNRPEAVGSELVVQDILSSVEFAKQQANIDPERIYLVGVSGGGYAALLLAGRSPETWTAVSAWVPIADLSVWHQESRYETKRVYWRHLEAACGGPPGASEEVDQQYKLRSAVTWLPEAKEVPIDINAGIHDGHSGSVPVSHSLWAFNCLAKNSAQFPEDVVKSIRKSAKIPKTMRFTGNDEAFGSKEVLMRRKSGNARITIFDGGHEIVVPAAFAWFDLHPRKLDGS